jgi:ribosomal protein S7
MLVSKFIKNKNLTRLYLIKNYRAQIKKNLYLKFIREEKKMNPQQIISEEIKDRLNKAKAILFLNNYYFLMHCLIKKGQKETLEKIFKKSLTFWIKSFSNKQFLFILMQAFQNTILHVGVFTKRKGSKNIHIPYKLPFKKSKFFAVKWILTNAFAKKKRKFFEGILEELIECSNKTSNTLKKREEFLKLAEENLNNLKKKQKF